jgi:hypothetical protein
MKADKYIELINKEISGDITPEESERLQRYLRDEPDARRIYRELHRTVDLLGAIDDVEPPAHLKQHIMNSVDFSRYRAGEPGLVLGFARRVKRLSLRPGFAYAFAAGVAVGLVIFSVFLSRPWGRQPAELRDLYATIGMTHQDVDFHTMESVPLDLPEAQGQIDLMRLADLLVLEVQLSGTRLYEVRLSYDPAEVRFNGLRPDAGRSLLSKVEVGRVSASGSGDSRFRLSLTKTAESALDINLELLISGETRLSHRFEIEDRDVREK